MKEKYILVCWPESQVLMEQEWFEECILMNDENHLNEVGSSAYFVPESRYNELNSLELQTAIEILEYHQEWRLGKKEDMLHEPKKITEALDMVISEVKKLHLEEVCRCEMPAKIKGKNQYWRCKKYLSSH